MPKASESFYNHFWTSLAEAIDARAEDPITDDTESDVLGVMTSLMTEIGVDPQNREDNIKKLGRLAGVMPMPDALKCLIQDAIQLNELWSAPIKRRAAHTKNLTPEFPHTPGCERCSELLRCNYCGGAALVVERCTNGRCAACHKNVCTPGGTTSPGHGFGGRSSC